MNTIDSAKKVQVIASPTTWMDGESVRQLEATAELPRMLRCVGMADMQAGKGSPSGAVFLSEDVRASLVGSDGGCGIGLSITSLSAKKARPEQIAKHLDGLDMPWDGDTAEWLTEATPFDGSLGTPGHGNHFIEVQEVVDVFDQDLFNRIGMDKDLLHLTVHSGSRGLGESIFRDYAAQNGAGGVDADSEAGQLYLKQAAQAMLWAVANRQLCTHRVMQALGGEARQLFDLCHNSVTDVVVDGCQCWLHRKGAAPSNQGPVLIPGSRDDLSFVVSPTEGDQSATLWSLAHGAGRKLSRSEAQGKLATLYKNKDIRKNQWGGRLVCGDKSLLWEEARECYKPINTVIDSMVDAGLITVVATLRPVVTFKTSEEVEKELRRDRRQWQTERSQARRVKGRR